MSDSNNRTGYYLMYSDYPVQIFNSLSDLHDHFNSLDIDDVKFKDIDKSLFSVVKVTFVKLIDELHYEK